MTLHKYPCTKSEIVNPFTITKKYYIIKSYCKKFKFHVTDNVRNALKCKIQLFNCIHQIIVVLKVCYLTLLSISFAVICNIFHFYCVSKLHFKLYNSSPKAKILTSLHPITSLISQKQWLISTCKLHDKQTYTENMLDKQDGENSTLWTPACN